MTVHVCMNNTAQYCTAILSQSNRTAFLAGAVPHGPIHHGAVRAFGYCHSSTHTHIQPVRGSPLLFRLPTPPIRDSHDMYDINYDILSPNKKFLYTF